MGQLANLFLIGDGRIEIYYTHWCADTLPYDLFWGPGHPPRPLSAVIGDWMRRGC